MASFILSLARETGWSERFIFWELPYWRMLHYQHAALRAADVWTVPPSEEAIVDPDTQLQQLLNNWQPA